MPGKSLIINVVIVLFLTGFVSCRAKQVAIKDQGMIMPPAPDKLPAVGKTLERQLKTLRIRKIEGSLSVNGNTMDVKGQLLLIRDSMIAVSVIPALGYEALRIMATPDSIILLNRQEKSYIASSLKSYFRKTGVPLDYYNIQSIIANELFYYNPMCEDQIVNRDEVNDETGIYYKLVCYCREKKVSSQTIRTHGGMVYPEEILIENYLDMVKSTVKYTEFNFYGNNYFPGKAELFIMDKNRTIELRLKYGQVVFDEAISVKFDVPKNYVKQDI